MHGNKKTYINYILSYTYHLIISKFNKINNFIYMKYDIFKLTF